MTRQVTFDLVSRNPKTGAWCAVLVEEGPWEEGAIDDELQRLQERLYDAVDVIVDGALASKYPESRGRPAVIRLDCYDVPREPAEEFFLRFADHIQADQAIQDAIARQGAVQSFGFRFSWASLKDG